MDFEQLNFIKYGNKWEHNPNCDKRLIDKRMDVIWKAATGKIENMRDFEDMLHDASSAK